MGSSNGVRFCLVLIMAAALYHGATAQSGCTTALISLTPCLNYVSGNSSTPSGSCCSQLSGVVSSQPQCLCQLVNGGGSSLGITINQTRALQLPSACRVTTPAVSRCNGGNAPSGSPGAGAGGSPPADSSNDSPGTPTGTTSPASPSDDGGSANTVPTTIGSSGASFTGMQLHVTLFLVLAASCTLSFV